MKWLSMLVDGDFSHSLLRKMGSIIAAVMPAEIFVLGQSGVVRVGC